MPETRPEITQIHASPEGLAVAIIKTIATSDDLFSLTSLVRISGGSWTKHNEADLTRTRYDGIYQIAQPHISADGEVWNETTSFLINPDGSVTITQTDNRFRSLKTSLEELLDIALFRKDRGMVFSQMTSEARVEMVTTPLGEAPVLSYLMRLEIYNLFSYIQERPYLKIEELSKIKPIERQRDSDLNNFDPRKLRY